MRNLKKVFAVILTVAILASLMVPALAAVSHEAEALKLQKIGLMAGGPADLKLDEGVTRIQGLAFAIRAAGKEAEALAMTEEEVAAELAKFVDSSEIPGWGRKYAAYAIKHGITVGVGNNRFAALDPISGTSFLVFLLKSGMGYSDVTTANVVDVAIEAGVLTAGQAVNYGSKAALIRDDAAAILFGAAMNGVNADGKSFIDSLIESGFVSEEAAIEAGFKSEATPVELKVVSVTTDNLKQLVVKFNQPIKEAGDHENYEIETDGNAVIDADSRFDLSEDKTTVVITLKDKTPGQAADQQEVVSLTVKDIEAVSGEKLDKVTIEDIELFDNTIPKAVSASVVGKYTIKVVFSEPIATLAEDLEDLFVVEDGDYIIEKVEKLTDYTAVNVKLYSALEEGTVKIECLNGIKDYAGYGIAKKTFSLNVVEDEEAPYIVGYKDAKPTGVTLIFNEDIVLTDDAYNDYDEYFFHTNSKNPVSVRPTVNGNELKLTFDSELPEGTAKIIIEKEALQDLWENDNAKITYNVEVTLDKTPPTIEKVSQDGDAAIKITFSEVLNEDTAKDVDNYTLLDKDGKVIEDAIDSADYDEEDDKGIVTLTFDSDLDLKGEYSIVVQKVEDVAGNKISKTTKTFEMKDTTPPTEPSLVKLYDAGKGIQLLKVTFGEAMAVTGAYSVLDLEKYEINGTILSDVDDVTIKAVDENKAVEIRIPESKLEVKAGEELVIARYADAAGNKLEKFATDPIEIEGADVVKVKSVELTAKDTIVVKLEDKLTTFKAADFTIIKKVADGEGGTEDVEVAYAKVKHTIDSKDNVSVITFTLKDEYGTAITDNLSVVIADAASKNAYGEYLEEDTFAVDDKAAPVVDKIVFKNATTIEVIFSEAIDPDTFLENAKNGFSVSGGKAKLTKVELDELDGNKITLTGEEFTKNTDVSYNDVFGLADGEGNKIASFNHTDALKVE